MPFLHWKLGALREAAGLTQGEAAKKSGVPLGTYRDIEQGVRKSPNIDAITKIAKLYGVELSELIGDDKPPKASAKRGRGRPKKSAE